eukprot:scaffold9235_cov112-Isochrysis_galbana.AAC.3
MPPIAYCSPFPSPPFLSLYSLDLLPYWAHGWPSALPRAACCVGAGHDCEIVPPSAIAQSMRHLQAAEAPPHPLAGLPRSSAHIAVGSSSSCSPSPPASTVAAPVRCPPVPAPPVPPEPPPPPAAPSPAVADRPADVSSRPPPAPAAAAAAAAELAPRAAGLFLGHCNFF